MNDHDGMQGIDSMEVYADWLEGHGDRKCFDVRSVAQIWRQLEAVIFREVAATGSRFYGDYSVESSDWDFFAWISTDEMDELLKLGWRRGSTNRSRRSVYKGCVNLLMAYDADSLAAMHSATWECVKANPRTRDQVVSIWQAWERHFQVEPQEATCES